MIDLFDGHCDTILRCYQDGRNVDKNDGHLDLTRTKKFGSYAQFFATFGAPEETPGKPLWDVFCEQHQLFCQQVDTYGDRIAHCRTGAQAQDAFAQGKVAAFLSAEGAELFDCDLNKLRLAHEMGVRAVNITWNHANALSGTNVDQPERGLSEQGRRFVTEMNRLGMLVDVSHISDPGFWDVISVTSKPIIATHSNARAVFFDTRNLTDEQFTAIIENNGVVGLNMYAGFLGDCPDIDTVIAHIEQFWALGGERHVALGGDWDGCAKLPRGIDGIQDVDRLYEALLRRNYHETLVRSLFYTNLMRIVSEVCSM